LSSKYDQVSEIFVTLCSQVLPSLFNAHTHMRECFLFFFVFILFLFFVFFGCACAFVGLTSSQVPEAGVWELVSFLNPKSSHCCCCCCCCYCCWCYCCLSFALHFTWIFASLGCFLSSAQLRVRFRDRVRLRLSSTWFALGLFYLFCFFFL